VNQYVKGQGHTCLTYELLSIQTRMNDETTHLMSEPYQRLNQ